MKTETQEKLNQHIADECSQIDWESRFDEMLDDCYSFEKVGGIFATMSPSRVLKEVDPIAYRCGVNDYEDGEGWVEIAGSYYDRDEAEKAKEEFASTLESEADEMEEEIDAEEAAEDADAAEIATKKEKLAAMRAEVAAVEALSL